MRVHLMFEIESVHLEDFKSRIPAEIEVSTGEQPDPGTTVLVTGFPPQEVLASLPHLKTVVIPFAGLQPRSREALLCFPQLKVYNLHHNAAATAEKAVELMMAVAKRTVPHDRSMRQGDWSPRFDRSDAVQLAGKTALVIGYGEIGKRVAKVCKGLSMEVLAVKRSVTGDEEGVYGPASLPELWPRAEVVLVCVPLTPETAGLLNREAIGSLPENAMVVNVGRGGIIDEQALYEALRSGRLHGAGLDVWWNYPAPGEKCSPSKYPYEELDNVVMSPHNGGTVDETEPARMQALAKLVVSILDGTCSQKPVDPESGY